MELVEEVDEFLEKMENKYAAEKGTKLSSNDLEQQLHILSMELDTLGFSRIDLKQSTNKLLEQIIGHTLLLIEIHRRTLSQITEINICTKQKDTKNSELEKTNHDLKKKLKQCENENQKLQVNLKKVTEECVTLKKTILEHNKEVEKIKRFYKSKQNDLVHNINSLKHENDRLKEICGQNLGKHFDKDEKLMMVLKKYRHKEEIYKNALRKLEENNTEIMNEILNLKSELALAYSKDEPT